MRRLMAFLLRIAVLAAILTAAVGLWRARTRSRHPSGSDPDAPFPFPAAPRPASVPHVHVPIVVDPGGGPETTTDTVLTAEPWMDPVDGACPTTHPVKAKLNSGIFHVPGGRNYERVNPDRCYIDPDAAQADGLRPPKS